MSAWVWATGAISPLMFSSPCRNPARSVRGELRLRIAGINRSTSGLSTPSAALIAGPRPATAPPNSTWLRWMLRRVDRWNVLKS